MITTTNQGTEMQINWKSDVRRGAYPRQVKNIGAAITTNSASRKNKGQTVITLYPPLMKKIRALVGDRALVGATDTHVAIKRVNEGGYAISALGASGKEREKKIGTPSSSSIKFSGDIGGFSFKSRLEFGIDEIEITDDGIVLLPVLDALTKSAITKS